MRAHRMPAVPLEAGAGPDNPPCPACGEPLFGWIDSRPGLGGPVRRCESCGLGVVGQSGGTQEALADLDRLRTADTVRILNRRSWSASLGGAGWAGLEPGARHLFAAEAVRRLVAERDQVTARPRWVPAASVTVMWQTVLNGFTFGRNIAVGALGQDTAVRAEHPWQRILDGLISVAVAVPAMIVALPMELIGAARGKGSVLAINVQLL